MKLYIFGSCSGTEPMEGRHHTSVSFEINGRLYWFDAGENCSYTAHLMGLDLLKVSDVFISHTHMDHIGGLANLLWNIRKLTWVKKIQPIFGDINVYMPNEAAFDAVINLLKTSEGGYRTEYKTLFNKVSDGTVMKNDDIEVEAVHNLHLPEDENGFRSYSYCIKAENKRVVYSGDIKDFDELSCFFKEDVDALLIETGHHSATEICQRIKDNGYNVKKVLFMHHGRGILKNPDDVLVRCREILPQAVICNDKDVFDI